MANHEPGYRPMLVWGHTKINLQEIRQRIGAERFCEERWLITAAAELVLARPDLHEAWIAAAYAMREREASFEASLEAGSGTVTRGEAMTARNLLASRAVELELALQGEVRIVKESIREVAAKVVQRMGGAPK